MDVSQHTVSDVVVHNIGSCMPQLGSDGAWQPFVGEEDGLRVNMYALALLCLYYHCRLTGMQKRDTLVRYLLDELYYYEEGHGDALRPVPREVNQSFLGEHAENHPATKQEVQVIMQELLETYHAAGQAGTVVHHGEHNPDSPHIAHTHTMRTSHHSS